ncbi:MAG: single-stranded DNA-binding protein [Actinomyces sp.]|uniref:single-stranded DNA-binding protein n=1 Tax=Actinomyces sp. TaxID=29317 RepID=UPI0026DC52A8|nr:single-stranded DNA-binding protein [Actinomyces sp.]MDO4243785.1 single-stranded DNA-binding protein [Actinomyces sp.]
MAGETVVTIVGNLTGDPELRFTQSGNAVASFTVASTPRAFDRASGEWKDGETLFMRCSIWREAAENVAESLVKGARVIVQGRLVQRSFTTREGEQRTVVEMQVDEVGPSLRYARAQVTRMGSGQAQGSPQGGGGQWGAPQSTAATGTSVWDQSAPPASPPQGRLTEPLGGPVARPQAPQQPPSTEDGWVAVMPGQTSFGDEPPF